MSRILIVDDKEENLYYLQALLSGHGHEVDSARHGAEALVKARLNLPETIISDLLMPVMDGYTLLRHWKADTRLKGIPFIVYTATYTEEADERLALDLGADAFILKPSEPEDFLRRLREAQTNVAAAIPAARPRSARGDETGLLKVYAETLIRKLEEKTLQLQEANRTLTEDIAERKRTQERIAEQAALLDQTRDAIIVRDLEHRILYWNRGAERLYGWRADEAIGRSVPELLYRVSRDFRVAADATLSKGEWVGELEQWTRSGKPVVVEGRWTLLRDEQGKPKSILAINSDITQRKKLESEFLRAQRMEGIGTLAGGIAHDLNNVLAPVIMSLELLKLKFPDDEASAILSTLESSAQRGVDLIRQVLSFARGVEGQRVIVNVLQVLREIQQVVRDTFPKSILFELSAEKDLWPVTGDPTQLHQVFLNLCVNARDAMPNGGGLKVCLENIVVDDTWAANHPQSRPGRYVAVHVADTGTGMPREIRDKIYEPFFTTKETGKGTGLGLSTAHAIIKSHGGFINLHTEVNKGTKFSVYLPANAAASLPDEMAAAQVRLPRGSGQCVLVVDDEESICKIARTTLERFGYRVLLASQGAEAASLYARHQHEIAVVLTDIAMPVMDGPALIIALKAMNPQVRIIGSSGDGSVAPAIRASLCDFVAKPYTAEALLQALEQALRTTAGPARS